jgi:hypothetical protein
MSADNHAKRVILISMMKSGTHLINELMLALGYRMYGHVRITDENRPVLDWDARWRMARLVYDEETVTSLKAQPEQAFNYATDQAWSALAWSWQARFGIPLTTLYSAELVDTGLVNQAQRRTADSSFADTPAGICWTFHEFDIKRIDGKFLREWAETGEPRIIFNYRDPRDTLISMVNYLCGQTKQGLSNYNNLPVFSRILLAKADLQERLAYALTDDSFPCQAGDFRRMLWLRHHPDVCKTTFEDLVGPNGGGSTDAQLLTTRRVMDFLQITDRSPEDVVQKLFNRSAFSFYRGQIGAWRDVITEDNQRLAESRFGEILSMYGYA